jgi:hypothetical protein
MLRVVHAHTFPVSLNLSNTEVLANRKRAIRLSEFEPQDPSLVPRRANTLETVPKLGHLLTASMEDMGVDLLWCFQAIALSSSFRRPKPGQSRARLVILSWCSTSRAAVREKLCP